MNTHRILDCHVHIIGNGSSGSGCSLNLRGLHRLQARYMLHHLGLPQSALSGDLDTLYAERLNQMVEHSSLDAVMALAYDHAYDEEGRIMEGVGSFYVPNDHVLNLAKRYPAFLPAVSIHPARKDALDELERCIEAGSRMLKLLPSCQNIDCRRDAYLPFWEKMAKAGMILLSHTGGELSVPIADTAYADPEILRAPLECGVTTVAAHAATSSFLDPSYIEKLSGMFTKYPRLYADNSALNTPIRSRHFKHCLRPEISARMLHGSDVPIPISGHWAALRGLISWAEYRRIARIDNPLERDFQLKKAIGFPEESFARLSALFCGCKGAGARVS
jgi:uncharacterized protein